jgi:hypothetical protein
MEHKKYTTTGSDTLRTQLYKNTTINPSRGAKQRLKWMKHFDKYRNARLTCRHFGISPDTFYLWKKKFDPKNIITLEDNFKNRKPHKLRVSKHEKTTFKTIKQLKDMDPRLGKIRISKILQEIGLKISSSTVGRILKKIMSEKG